MAHNCPDNTNFFNPENFKIVFDRLPNLSYWCTRATIPSVTVEAPTHATPLHDFPIPGEKQKYENLVFTFKVDEDLVNYKAVKAWMDEMADPENYEGREEKFVNLMSDSSVFVFTNNLQANIEFIFVDCFPITLGQLNLNLEAEPGTPLTCDVSFGFTRFNIKDVT